MYKQIDDRAIGIAQQISNYFQKQTKLNNFLIAKILAALGTMLPAIMYALINIFRTKDSPIGESLEPFHMFILMAMTTFIIFMVFTKRIFFFDEEKVIREAQQSLANSERYNSESYMKRFSIFMNIWFSVALGVYFKIIADSLLFFLLSLTLFVIWISYLFLACTPMPPSEEVEDVKNLETVTVN